jgi:hypothetical protein
MSFVINNIYSFAEINIIKSFGPLNFSTSFFKFINKIININFWIYFIINLNLLFFFFFFFFFGGVGCFIFLCTQSSYSHCCSKAFLCSHIAVMYLRSSGRGHKGGHEPPAFPRLAQGSKHIGLNSWYTEFVCKVRTQTSFTPHV